MRFCIKLRRETSYERPSRITPNANRASSRSKCEPVHLTHSGKKCALRREERKKEKERMASWKLCFRGWQRNSLHKSTIMLIFLFSKAELGVFKESVQTLWLFTAKANRAMRIHKSYKMYNIGSLVNVKNKSIRSPRDSDGCNIDYTVTS